MKKRTNYLSLPAMSNEELRAAKLESDKIHKRLKINSKTGKRKPLRPDDLPINYLRTKGGKLFAYQKRQSLEVMRKRLISDQRKIEKEEKAPWTRTGWAYIRGQLDLIGWLENLIATRQLHNVKEFSDYYKRREGTMARLVHYYEKIVPRGRGRLPGSTVELDAVLTIMNRKACKLKPAVRTYCQKHGGGPIYLRRLYERAKPYAREKRGV